MHINKAIKCDCFQIIMEGSSINTSCKSKSHNCVCVIVCLFFKSLTSMLCFCFVHWLHSHCLFPRVCTWQWHSLSSQPHNATIAWLPVCPYESHPSPTLPTKHIPMVLLNLPLVARPSQIITMLEKWPVMTTTAHRHRKVCTRVEYLPVAITS